MKNTKIYKALSAYNAPKLNRFSKLISSPYHNKNEHLISLATILIDEIKKTDKTLTKEAAWSRIYPGIPYSDLKFRKLCNDLLSVLEDFLTIESLNQYQLIRTNLLLEQIREDKLEVLYNKLVSKSRRHLKRSLEQSSDYYLQQYYFEKNLYNLKSQFEKKSERTLDKKSINYEALEHNIDIFYVIEKLRHACMILGWKRLYKIDIEIDLNNVMDILQNDSIRAIPAVELYYEMYLMLSDEHKVDHYNHLKALAQKHLDKVSRSEQREIIDAMLSYCINWVNKGDMEFLKETLFIYDWAIDEELILENNELSPTTFRNYVVGRLRLGQYREAETFIQAKAHLLNVKYRDNAVNFNMARVCFYRKNYRDVLGYLNLVDYEDVWYNVNSKILLLATYYELDEIIPLESAIDSFTAYLRREKSLDTVKNNAYLNFTKYLKKLIRIPPSQKERLSKLQDKITDVSPMFNKLWLLRKIEEIL